ncbi:MAG TPA: hypothetical protein VE131_00385 [Terriglobales bacterium]|nr:hypothetical protein [Terriglobales bacterium]
MGKLIADAIHMGLVLLGLIPLAGCSVLYQQAVAASREPGDHIATTPDRVWADFKCGERQRPFVHIESMEVIPQMVRPGARVNYRLIYVMCPRQPSEVIETFVERRLLFKGEPVARNTHDDFELKPGRWIVDSFLTLPKNAPLGVYALEIVFNAPEGQSHKRVRSFVVANEPYLSGP